MTKMSGEFRLADEAATRALGATIMASLQPGDVVLLEGGLGAGKTTLVRGALESIGHPAFVRSPTFNLMQTFATVPPVLHADLYRLGEGSDFGLFEAMEGRVAFIEWPDRMPQLYRIPGVWVVRLEPLGEGRSASVRRS